MSRQEAHLVDEAVVVERRVKVNEAQEVANRGHHAFADMVSTLVSPASWTNISRQQDRNPKPRWPDSV